MSNLALSIFKHEVLVVLCATFDAAGELVTLVMTETVIR